MPDQPLSLTVTLETVTPLFLGGAKPKDEPPELRPPAFRGVMRYWWRAALGGVIGDRNLEGLHKLETVVFGSVGYGSSVALRLRPVAAGLMSQDEKILPHKEGPRAGSRKAFASNQRFELKMLMPRSEDTGVWEAASAALRLALTFGGAGLRSRRGLGTLKVIQSSSPALVPLSPVSLLGWQQYAVQTAEQAVIAARNLAQSEKVSVLSQPPSGPTGFPCANRDGLMRVHDLRAADAMEAVRRFMNAVPADPAFGGINPRQASPLWVRPIETENGYGLLLLMLASRLKSGTNLSNVQGFIDKHFPGIPLKAKGWNA